MANRILYSPSFGDLIFLDLLLHFVSPSSLMAYLAKFKVFGFCMSCKQRVGVVFFFFFRCI